MRLAVSGLLLQSATGNDLCSPNIIGVNSGAGLAVMVMLCLFPMAFAGLQRRCRALATTLLVLGISVSAGGHQS
ncbi:MAG: iron chelate uptake ABC transporter family permease subunit [Holdemania massiliensis]